MSWKVQEEDLIALGQIWQDSLPHQTRGCEAVDQDERITHPCPAIAQGLACNPDSLDGISTLHQSFLSWRGKRQRSFLPHSHVLQCVYRVPAGVGVDGAVGQRRRPIYKPQLGEGNAQAVERHSRLPITGGSSDDKTCVTARYALPPMTGRATGAERHRPALPSVTTSAGFPISKAE